MALSKKKRFEVFKRDKFTCQYCGEKAPDVILHVDHVQPKSKGGADAILNLVTACVECNQGKGARELSDDSVIQKQRSQLGELQERREQVEMMVEWQRSLLDLDGFSFDQATDFWKELLGGQFFLNDKGLNDLREYISRFGVSEVLEGMRLAVQKYIRYEDEVPTPTSVQFAWEKVGGICYNQSRWRGDTDREALDKAFWRFEQEYREHCSHHPERWQLRRWWQDNVEGLIRDHGASDRAQRIAARVVGMCVSEYLGGPHSSYWSALQELPSQYDPGVIISDA